MRPLLLAATTLLLTACYGLPVDRVSPLASGQKPVAGPDAAWTARGRLTLVLPGKVMSLALFLRRSAGGELRAAMMDDGGLMACDIAYGQTGAVIHHCRDELVQLVPVFESLLLGAYHPAIADATTWRSGRLQERTERWKRWYGGDPLALRYVRGRGWPVTVGDYRIAAGMLIAHRVHADGPWGAELQLELDTVGSGDSPPP